MKEKFYVHGTDELINLAEESEILKKDWSQRSLVKHPESVTYHEIYNREDYFQGVCKIQPGDIVVDCGGNIGIFSSLALDMGASRVLSFEPFINNYLLCRKNNPNAEVFNNAVSNKTGEKIELLYTDSGNGGHSIIDSLMESEKFGLSLGHFQHKNLFIETITLNDIIEQNYIDHIDFLKIDTEGAELMILDGLSDENLDKIRCISLEYHHNVFNFDDNVYNKFQQRFLKRGFNVCTWLLDKYTRMTYIAKGDVFTQNPKHL